MLPMVLQQIVHLDDENTSQPPTAVIRKVKKRKPTTIIIEEPASDSSSSDSLPLDLPNVTENVPIQRPKRSKTLLQQKLNYMGKNHETKTLNSFSKLP